MLTEKQEIEIRAFVGSLHNQNLDKIMNLLDTDAITLSEANDFFKSEMLKHIAGNMQARKLANVLLDTVKTEGEWQSIFYRLFEKNSLQESALEIFLDLGVLKIRLERG